MNEVPTRGTYTYRATPLPAPHRQAIVDGLTTAVGGRAAARRARSGAIGGASEGGGENAVSLRESSSDEPDRVEADAPVKLSSTRPSEREAISGGAISTFRKPPVRVESHLCTDPPPPLHHHYPEQTPF